MKYLLAWMILKYDFRKTWLKYPRQHNTFFVTCCPDESDFIPITKNKMSAVEKILDLKIS